MYNGVLVLGDIVMKLSKILILTLIISSNVCFATGGTLTEAYTKPDGSKVFTAFCDVNGEIKQLPGQWEISAGGSEPSQERVDSQCTRVFGERESIQNRFNQRSIINSNTGATGFQINSFR